MKREILRKRRLASIEPYKGWLKTMEYKCYNVDDVKFICVNLLIELMKEIIRSILITLLKNRCYEGFLKNTLL
jgi:hypothetical protein